MSNDEEIYTFVVEWYDSVADLTRKYNLTYWPKDTSLSMYDLTKNRLFLKRVVNKDILFPNDLYIGKTIVVFSRQLKIIGYADTFTKNKFQAISTSYNIAFVGFKPFTTFLAEMNEYKAPFHCKTIKSVLINSLMQRYLKIEKENEILIIGDFVGGEHIQSAYNKCKSNNGDFNAIMYNEADDKQFLQLMNECKTSAILSDNEVSSLCLIKPHALSAAPSLIVDILNEGFTIAAVTTKKMTLSEVRDFYQVYNGVVKEYSYMVEQLLSGSVIALQIKCAGFAASQEKENTNKNAINTNQSFIEFREFVGPKDPEIAKYIRPHTLRAKYGFDRVQNAIHCTDLEEDGNLESRFFFQILDS
eukprot:352206_1